MTERRYFTAADTRLLIGRRVQVRVAPGYQGTAYFASGPEAGEYILGVRWDAGPPIQRVGCYPLDWYTVEEYRRLLEPAVEKAA